MDKYAAIAEIQKEFSKQTYLDLIDEQILARAKETNSTVADIQLLRKNFIAGFVRIINEDEGRKIKVREGNCMVERRVSLWQCHPKTLAGALLESCRLGLPVDDRQLAYVYPVPDGGGYKCEFDISYKGYVYRVQELYENADIVTCIVWPEDIPEFKWKQTDTKVEYSYTPANPFRSDYEAAIGAFCIIYYTMNGEPRSRGERIGSDELKTIRSKAKTQIVWREFGGEMIKKTVIRRACKLPAARNEQIAKMERVSNRAFDLEKPTALEAPNRAALLTKSLYGGNDAQNDPPAVEHKKEQGKGGVPGNDENPSGDDGNNAEDTQSGGEASVKEETGETKNTQAKTETATSDGDKLETGTDTATGGHVDAGDMQADEPAEESAGNPADAGEQASQIGAWDRRSIIMKGGPARKNWSSPETAANFLKQHLSAVKKEEARALVQANAPLIATLFAENYHDVAESMLEFGSDDTEGK